MEVGYHKHGTTVKKQLEMDPEHFLYTHLDVRLNNTFNEKYVNEDGKLHEYFRILDHKFGKAERKSASTKALHDKAEHVKKLKVNQWRNIPVPLQEGFNTLRDAVMELNVGVSTTIDDFILLYRTVQTIENIREMSLRDMEGHIINKLQQTYERVLAENKMFIAKHDRDLQQLREEASAQTFAKAKAYADDQLQQLEQKIDSKLGDVSIKAERKAIALTRAFGEKHLFAENLIGEGMEFQSVKDWIKHQHNQNLTNIHQTKRQETITTNKLDIVTKDFKELQAKFEKSVPSHSQRLNKIDIGFKTTNQLHKSLSEETSKRLMELDIWVTDLRQQFSKKTVQNLREIGDHKFQNLNDRLREVEATLDCVDQSKNQSISDKDSGADSESESAKVVQKKASLKLNKQASKTQSGKSGIKWCEKQNSQTSKEVQIVQSSKAGDNILEKSLEEQINKDEDQQQSTQQKIQEDTPLHGQNLLDQLEVKLDPVKTETKEETEKQENYEESSKMVSPLKRDDSKDTLKGDTKRLSTKSNLDSPEKPEKDKKSQESDRLLEESVDSKIKRAKTEKNTSNNQTKRSVRTSNKEVVDQKIETNQSETHDGDKNQNQAQISEAKSISKKEKDTKKSATKAKVPMRTPAEQMNEIRERLTKIETWMEKHIKEFDNVRGITNKANNDLIRLKLQNKDQGSPERLNNMSQALQNKFLQNVDKIADNARAFSEQNAFLQGKMQNALKRHQSQGAPYEKSKTQVIQSQYDVKAIAAQAKISENSQSPTNKLPEPISAKNNSVMNSLMKKFGSQFSNALAANNQEQIPKSPLMKKLKNLKNNQAEKSVEKQEEQSPNLMAKLGLNVQQKPEETPAVQNTETKKEDQAFDFFNFAGKTVIEEAIEKQEQEVVQVKNTEVTPKEQKLWYQVAEMLEKYAEQEDELHQKDSQLPEALPLFQSLQKAIIKSVQKNIDLKLSQPQHQHLTSAPQQINISLQNVVPPAPLVAPAQNVNQQIQYNQSQHLSQNHQSNYTPQQSNMAQQQSNMAQQPIQTSVMHSKLDQQSFNNSVHGTASGPTNIVIQNNPDFQGRNQKQSGVFTSRQSANGKNSNQLKNQRSRGASGGEIIVRSQRTTPRQMLQSNKLNNKSQGSKSINNGKTPSEKQCQKSERQETLNVMRTSDNYNQYSTIQVDQSFNNQSPNLLPHQNSSLIQQSNLQNQIDHEIDLNIANDVKLMDDDLNAQQTFGIGQITSLEQQKVFSKTMPQSQYNTNSQGTVQLVDVMSDNQIAIQNQQIQNDYHQDNDHQVVFIDQKISDQNTSEEKQNSVENIQYVNHEGQFQTVPVNLALNSSSFQNQSITTVGPEQKSRNKEVLNTLFGINTNQQSRTITPVLTTVQHQNFTNLPNHAQSTSVQNQSKSQQNNIQSSAAVNQSQPQVQYSRMTVAQAALQHQSYQYSQSKNVQNLPANAIQPMYIVQTRIERGGSAHPAGRVKNQQQLQISGPQDQSAILRVNAFKPCDKHLNDQLARLTATSSKDKKFGVNSQNISSIVSPQAGLNNTIQHVHGVGGQPRTGTSSAMDHQHQVQQYMMTQADLERKCDQERRSYSQLQPRIQPNEQVTVQILQEGGVTGVPHPHHQRHYQRPQTQIDFHQHSYPTEDQLLQARTNNNQSKTYLDFGEQNQNSLLPFMQESVDTATEIEGQKIELGKRFANNMQNAKMPISANVRTRSPTPGEYSQEQIQQQPGANSHAHLHGGVQNLNNNMSQKRNAQQIRTVNNSQLAKQFGQISSQTLRKNSQSQMRQLYNAPSGSATPGVRQKNNNNAQQNRTAASPCSHQQMQQQQQQQPQFNTGQTERETPSKRGQDFEAQPQLDRF